MHMADALVSPAVAGTMYAVSAAAAAVPSEANTVSVMQSRKSTTRTGNSFFTNFITNLHNISQKTHF